MSKTTYKEIAPYFGRTPSDHEYKAFANGIEGKLVLSWQHPIPHPDPDSDEAPEGSNHLRIEVITDSKPDWTAFDLDNWEEELPKPENGKLLIIDGRYKRGSRFEVFFCMDFGQEKEWKKYPWDSIQTVFEKEHFKQTYYKLIDEYNNEE
jgi:hypothetical protein